MTDVTDDRRDATDDAESDALAAVVDGALERALLDEADSRRYFALAGAVDRGREGAADARSDSLTAALVCTAAVSALSTTSAEPTWSPPDPRNELVAAGAVGAVRRLGADPERVAARAGLPLSDLRTRLSRARATDRS